MSSDNKTKDIEETTYFYINDEAKQTEFADYVRISSYQHGIILRFGRLDIDEKKFGIFRSILLPYPVVGSMNEILTKQIDKLIADGLLIKEALEKDKD